MVRKYFGTDGIRGRANGVITPELALKVGQAAGLVFQRGDHRHRVVIGKDTRLSGYMIETALVAGFTSVGMDVLLLGPVPTPAVAMLTRSMRADLGVMISASHNPFEDNGIKLFGPDGFKLSDAIEREIENINLSRTLNFVFRQMNQKFVTMLHLTDVRVAFFNGDGAPAQLWLFWLAPLVGAAIAGIAYPFLFGRSEELADRPVRDDALEGAH